MWKRRKTDKPKISFHTFCVKRMLPLEMEIRFIEWFKDYFNKEFSSDDDVIFNYLVNEMSEDEILEWWNAYLRDLKFALPK